MAFVQPVTLRRNGVRLEPLTPAHTDGLAAAAADGQLWRLRVAGVPAPEETRTYVQTALDAMAAGQRMAFAVVDAATGRVLGTTSYYLIEPALRRLYVGYTWYAQSVQRSHVNTTCKLLLLEHAFDTLGCHVVGWRTDIFNIASQRAIERLGAKKDGVLRGDQLRRDGTIRDTVVYSLRSGEWPESRAQLLHLLELHAPIP